MGVDGTTPTRLSLVPIIELGTANNNAMNRSRENLAVTISADWRSPIVSATIYLRVARRGSINADVITLNHAVNRTSFTSEQILDHSR